MKLGDILSTIAVVLCVTASTLLPINARYAPSGFAGSVQCTGGSSCTEDMQNAEGLSDGVYATTTLKQDWTVLSTYKHGIATSPGSHYVLVRITARHNEQGGRYAPAGIHIVGLHSTTLIESVEFDPPITYTTSEWRQITFLSTTPVDASVINNPNFGVSFSFAAPGDVNCIVDLDSVEIQVY